ncbi:MAG TPA: biopolymer transporter ExbD [Bacteroidetes bacterium]|nr:biopolymer transporter ExbD [Bacteroidota bacterium]
MKFEATKKRLTSFSTIGLTDIVLLLLIFFMLSSSFIVQPGIKVQLPKATTAAVESKGRIYVTINAKNQIFLNQERIGKSNLGGKIHKLLQKNAERIVVIQADKNITLEKTIDVIDIIKMAGGEKFVIATQPG